MQFIPFRLLRNQPNELRQKLAEEGQLIVTNHGEPFALMVNLEQGEIEDLMFLVAQLRAQRAVSAMRAAAQREGLDQLTEEEIEAEIWATRQER